ncbi:hypothetical protein AB0P21_39030 [Kribbella sp. NPDC056861]|uniref:hypothetical protein n=1 Tax=Kribbella sp. NPDC056861 TaxID=3154857 RepID=UPI00342708E9
MPVITGLSISCVTVTVPPLFGLARAILGGPGEAETVVVEVITRACTDPGATTTSSGSGSLRRELPGSPTCTPPAAWTPPPHVQAAGRP